ncbi:MAG: hypothetical protein LBN74_01545 [Prevotella sp.]|nr:hypothetical protein [Prevotella sp.]
MSTGDTTRVVNKNYGLRGSGADFLLKKPRINVDSLIANTDTQYSNLEEALLDANNMLAEIEKDNAKLNKPNAGLGYRLSKTAIEDMQKEKRAKVLADSILKAREKQSMEELAKKYLTFGNKPTYYINGINVRPEAINQLMSGDIIERNLKIQDTASGNPNGEVWFTITDKAARRIGINGVGVQTARNERYIASESTLPPAYTDRKEKQSNVKYQEVSKDSGTRYPEPVVETKIANTKVSEDSPKRSVRRIKAEREARQSKDDEVKSTPVYKAQPVQERVQAQQTPPPPKTEQARTSVVAQPVVTAQPKREEPVRQNVATLPVVTTQPKREEQNRQVEIAVQPKQERVVSEAQTGSAPENTGRRTIVQLRTVNNVPVKASKDDEVRTTPVYQSQPVQQRTQLTFPPRTETEQVRQNVITQPVETAQPKREEQNRQAVAIVQPKQERVVSEPQTESASENTGRRVIVKSRTVNNMPVKVN